MVEAQVQNNAVATPEPPANNFTVSGRCVDDADRSPLAGITVRLYRVEGRTSAPMEVARTVTDAAGKYAFTGLIPPLPEDHLHRLEYGVLGFCPDQPIGISFLHFRDREKVVELRMTRKAATLSGQVRDAAGRPVTGATVRPYFVYDRPATELPSAITDADGRFQISSNISAPGCGSLRRSLQNLREIDRAGLKVVVD